MLVRCYDSCYNDDECCVAAMMIDIMKNGCYRDVMMIDIMTADVMML